MYLVVVEECPQLSENSYNVFIFTGLELDPVPLSPFSLASAEAVLHCGAHCHFCMHWAAWKNVEEQGTGRMHTLHAYNAWSLQLSAPHSLSLGVSPPPSVSSQTLILILFRTLIGVKRLEEYVMGEHRFLAHPCVPFDLCLFRRRVH